MKIKAVYNSIKHRMKIEGVITSMNRNNSKAYITPDNTNIPPQLVPVRLIMRMWQEDESGEVLKRIDIS